eukprot:7386889-Prymnesium_polylepis.2
MRNALPKGRLLLLLGEGDVSDFIQNPGRSRISPSSIVLAQRLACLCRPTELPEDDKDEPVRAAAFDWTALLKKRSTSSWSSCWLASGDPPTCVQWAGGRIGAAHRAVSSYTFACQSQPSFPASVRARGD